MYLHPTYAVTPERQSLSLLDAWMWARNFKDSEGERTQSGERARRVEGCERGAERAAHLLDTHLVGVCGRPGIGLLHRLAACQSPRQALRCV